jgi:hypothetical protein
MLWECPVNEVEPTVVDFLPGHPLSYTTTNLQVFRDSYKLANATGFVVKLGQIYALVTNWHVLSGINPATGNCLSKTGALPNRIECHVTVCRKLEGEPEGEALHFKPLAIDLLQGDRPIWIDENSSVAQNDYAAIKISHYLPELEDRDVSLRSILAGRVVVRPQKEIQIPADSVRMHIDDVKSLYPAVGSEVFVLGYPSGIAHRGVFPIWKRGSIASEPQAEVELNGIEYKNVFYIDALTKAGMSGAPVIWLPQAGDYLYTEDGGRVRVVESEPYIIGVYAGREGITQEEYELSLGRVWKIGAVERLLIKFGSDI